MLLHFLHHNAEAVYVARAAEVGRPCSVLFIQCENQRVTKLTEFCLICLVCATRANTRHFNNLTQTLSNHCRLLIPTQIFVLEVSLYGGHGAKLSFFCLQRWSVTIWKRQSTPIIHFWQLYK